MKVHAKGLLSVAALMVAVAGVLLPAGAASAQSNFFVERFMGANLGVHLQDADAGFQLAKGSISRNGDEGPASSNRHYIATTRHDYMSNDWTCDITFFSPLYAPDDILFIGIGEAVPDGTYFNEPQNSVNFRIHQGEFAFFTGWRVDVAAHSVGYGVFTYFDLAIGYLPPNRPDGGLYIARVRKSGNAMTFTILGVDPPVIATIPDLAAAAPFLDASNSRIFFGNASSAYSFADMRVLPAAVATNN